MAETRTYPRLQLNSGSTYNITAGDTIIVQAYTAGDWDGAIITSTGTWYLQMPSGVQWVSVNITNCDASGGFEIDATDPSNTDGGGNTNIDFGGVTGSLYQAVERGVLRGVERKVI